MANTIKAQEIWDTRLASRLDKPQNWKDVCDVVYTDTQTVVLPYVSTTNEPAVSSLLTSVADRSDMTKVVPFVSITMSTETLQVISTETDNVYVDFADQAQSSYAKIGELADLLGKKVGERVEALALAGHADWTNIGDDGSGNVALSSTNITVTSTNIDDICRGVIEQIFAANGFDQYNSNGGFVVWRAADWTKLVTFMQANGFAFADEALKTGGRIGKEALGLFHYVSTQHTANHLFAGVRKTYKLGLLNSTFGKAMIVDHPASSTAGFMSGTSVYHRLDYGRKMQTNLLPITFDVNVA